MEYWSVDFHYDGRVHNPQFSFPKENHTMEKVCRQIVSDTGKISVRAVDVFGNSSLKVLDMGEVPEGEREMEE